MIHRSFFKLHSNLNMRKIYFKTSRTIKHIDITKNRWNESNGKHDDVKNGINIILNLNNTKLDYIESICLSEIEIMINGEKYRISDLILNANKK